MECFTFNVIRQVGEIEPELGLDPQPVRSVEVWSRSKLIGPIFILRLGVSQEQANGLTQLKIFDKYM